MARDDFNRGVADRLAKRVGMRCSFPDCRRPTAGPDAGDGVTNVGVAAHISAASPGGPRYDVTLTPALRSDFANGIWLCQTHAKLVDDDELTYPQAVLRQWKETAEHMAALEAQGYVVRRALPFADLKMKAPKLLAEMRADLKDHPLVREFVLIRRGYSYNYGEHQIFTYYHDDHDYLAATMTIMQHVGAIYEITHNNTPRFNLTEEFVAYLTEER